MLIFSDWNFLVPFSPLLPVTTDILARFNPHKSELFPTKCKKLTIKNYSFGVKKATHLVVWDPRHYQKASGQYERHNEICWTREKWSVFDLRVEMEGKDGDSSLLRCRKVQASYRETGRLRQGRGWADRLELLYKDDHI